MLPEFRLEAYFGVWEFKARHHLTASDAQTMALHELLEFSEPADRARWEQLRLGYVQMEGTPELREAIARTFERLDADDVVCFAGAEEGLYCAMQALLEPDDHAVVLVPNYQSMETVPLSLCEVSGVLLRYEHGWKLDLDQLCALLRPNTKLVAVNFPNNPTGATIPPEEFEALIGICSERGLYLFSDEVYRGIERVTEKRLPQAADRYERALSLNTVSKAYGLPGLRVGWIACRAAHIRGRMLQVKQYLSICNAGPCELLATIALKARERIFARNRALIVENLEKLDRFFRRNAARFEWYAPDGGCIAFPRYLGGDGVEAFCARLVDRAGVLLLPASVYRSELAHVPEDRFRIGYGRCGIDEALEAFQSFLN